MYGNATESAALTPGIIKSGVELNAQSSVCYAKCVYVFSMGSVFRN